MRTIKTVAQTALLTATILHAPGLVAAEGVPDIPVPDALPDSALQCQMKRASSSRCNSTEWQKCIISYQAKARDAYNAYPAKTQDSETRTKAIAWIDSTITELEACAKLEATPTDSSAYSCLLAISYNAQVSYKRDSGLQKDCTGMAEYRENTIICKADHTGISGSTEQDFLNFFSIADTYANANCPLPKIYARKRFLIPGILLGLAGLGLTIAGGYYLANPPTTLTSMRTCSFAGVMGDLCLSVDHQPGRALLSTGVITMAGSIPLIALGFKKR